MSELEISRRCPDCGVSIRERAFFCPQCGVSIGGDQPAVETATLPTEAAVTQKLNANGDKARKNKHSTTSIVLNEVAYDPSLRFVFVAALLFVIFLIIVIVSKIIT
jgi:uncharacterized membrane protein YvbJ